MRALAMVAVLGLAAPVQAYTVTTGAPAVGDAPSVVAPYALPEPMLAEKKMSSSLSGAAASSSLAPAAAESSLSETARKSLQELGATEEGGQIRVTLPGDVLFDFDKSDIRADARPVLDQLAEILLVMPDEPVAITGHTDAKGSDDYNQSLSEARAASVRDWLADLGVDTDRMSSDGAGEAQPVVPNQKADGSDDPEGRQKNRRVEFLIGSGD